MKKPIKYEVGDATNPAVDNTAIIVHCCNDLGAWGAGFVMALSRKWDLPEKRYREWSHEVAMAKDEPSLQLGAVQFVKVEPKIIVANMIGQEGVGYHKGKPPIRYDAIRTALQKVYRYATDYTSKSHYPTIVGPRFGAGLAGGDWNEIEKIITEELSDKGLQVVIYDLPARN